LKSIILVVIVVGIVIIAAISTFYYVSNVTKITKNFSYTEPISQGQSPSILVSDLNGVVNIIPWGQSNRTLINGTITARGIGASPDALTLVQSDTSGTISFVAKFPSTSNFFLFSQDYEVSVNVYVPLSAHFNATTVETVNGDIDVGTLNSTKVLISTVNGGVTFSSLSCINLLAKTVSGVIQTTLRSVSPMGLYTVSTVNGNVGLTIPASSSFKLTASTVNGIIQTSGLSLSNTAQASNSLSATVGGGNATVALSTVNGGITITGVSG
jgi:hypothetical protein